MDFFIIPGYILFSLGPLAACEGSCGIWMLQKQSPTILLPDSIFTLCCLSHSSSWVSPNLGKKFPSHCPPHRDTRVLPKLLDNAPWWGNTALISRFGVPHCQHPPGNT